MFNSANLGDDLVVEAELLKPTKFLHWYRGRKQLKTDLRFTVTYDEASGLTSMTLKKAKYSDEAKYKIAVETESGEEIDFTGFSVFVKGECCDAALCVKRAEGSGAARIERIGYSKSGCAHIVGLT